MYRQTRQILSIVVVLLGLLLIIGGIGTEKKGAVVIGMLVAGVAAQQFITLRKQSGGGS